jgi:5,5'-dehydrodivanillate O-demethylase oxygenase subunit
MMATTNGHTRAADREAEYSDFAHTGPGTLAGRFMRRFWQPIYLGADLPPGHAKPIRVMSEDFTLYRGEGATAHLVAYRCAHRGTQLSTGWVEGDCIRCFYHGWKYDGSGQCVEMPAEDPSFPPKVQIASYPTEEYLGLIFTYLGEGEPPPFPSLPEFEADGVLQARRYTRYCNYFNNVENQCDEVHVAFAHRDSAFSDAGLNPWDIPQVGAEETDYGMRLSATRSDGIARITHFMMPAGIYIKGSPDDAESGWVDQIAWRVPVDDTYHHSFNLVLTHVTGEAAERFRARQAERQAQLTDLPAPDQLAAAVLRGELRVHDIRDYAQIVNVQDNVAQVGQGIIADRMHERLGRSDVQLILLRQIWRRELKALAEGRPLKQWTRTERIAATSGVASE